MSEIIEENETLEQFAENGVLPERVSGTGAAEEPLIEVIICDRISGGARYRNGMPAELSLIRRTADGKEYRANYCQFKKL